MDDAAFTVRAFVPAGEPEVEHRCEGLLREVSPLPVEVVRVAPDAVAWRESWLRTLPAVEIRRHGEVVYQASGSLDVGRALDDLRADAETRAGSIRRLPMTVTESTGCYRYDRWNELHLVGPADGMSGWSSPIREVPGGDVLTFDLSAQCEVEVLSLTPRPWGHLDDYRSCFPKAFNVELSRDRTTWRTALTVSDHVCGGPMPQTWELSGTGRYVRIEVTDLWPRRDGRFVGQLGGVELWGRHASGPGAEPPVVGRWLPRTGAADDGAILKSGVIGTAHAKVVTWRLPAGRALPERTLLSGQAKFVVVQGRADVQVGAWQDTLGVGDWWLVKPGDPCRISAPGPDACVLLELQEPSKVAEAWARRPPPTA